MLNYYSALTLFSFVKTIFVAFNAGFNSAIVFLVVFIISLFCFFPPIPLTFHPNKFLTDFTELYTFKKNNPIEYAKEF